MLRRARVAVHARRDAAPTILPAAVTLLLLLLVGVGVGAGIDVEGVVVLTTMRTLPALPFPVNPASDHLVECLLALGETCRERGVGALRVLLDEAPLGGFLSPHDSSDRAPAAAGMGGAADAAAFATAQLRAAVAAAAGHFDSRLAAVRRHRHNTSASAPRSALGWPPAGLWGGAASSDDTCDLAKLSAVVFGCQPT
jgi:hypothetical protein